MAVIEDAMAVALGDVAVTITDARAEEAATHSSAKAAAGKSAMAFRTISEVSADLEIPQHVLRFWETKFTQLRPLKRGGGRRYYRPEDIALLRRIHGLLYSEGYTIKGVQQLLRRPRAAALAAKAVETPAPVIEPTIPGLPKPPAQDADRLLRDLLAELKQLRLMLD
jgi:DNA-binding transcriptional MerR regulator